jgi:2,3,4,5-tetrahydropyridine-2-carboxylate N-succinyltransferase
VSLTDVGSLRADLARFPGEIRAEERREARSTIARLLRALESGQVRAAEPRPDGTWEVQRWVKEGILLGFRLGRAIGSESGIFSFVDKDTFPPRRFGPEDGVRIVPGGSAVRSGAFVGRGVVCMPPMFVNVGAYVGDDSMIDSHALVGSCAQVGRRVHLSAGAQLGGVLEPATALPVIIEDDVLIGGNCGVFEGTIVRSGAVLAPGTMLSAGTPVFDLVRDRVYRRSGDRPLEIPAGAVVVPGTRPVASAPASAPGIALYAPVIVKYRDEKTETAVKLEELLR